MVDLRIAESDYFLKRYAAARDGVQPVSRPGVAQGRSAVLLSQRAARPRRARPGRRRSRAPCVADFPDSSWAGEALNNLGTHYIVTNQDDLAAQTFKELFDKFPDRPARRARRVEVRLVGLHDRQLRRDRARLREAPRRRSRGRTTARRGCYWAARAREKLGERETVRGAHASRLHRLPELVLRPARRAAGCRSARAATAPASGARPSRSPSRLRAAPPAPCPIRRRPPR